MSQRPTARRTVTSPPSPAEPKSSTRRTGSGRSPGNRRPAEPKPAEPGYSRAELEFMQAMQDYKQSSGRMFPTWSEVLEVLKALGYAKNA
ncbi:MAG: hypothetical protein P4L84_30445 [Isosphaeraceae bacterium]|nr:hypothetical protein [Isosphaeraceae bacterium]